MTPYYDENGITIYHADCAVILPTIDPSDVDLLLTDPPYGIGSLGKSKFGARFNSGSGKFATTGSVIVADDEPFDPAPLLRFERCVLWGANNYAAQLPNSGGWIVWDKAPGEESTLFKTSDAELAWTQGLKTYGVRRFNRRWRSASKDGEPHLHPTQKPTSLMRWIVDRWTERDDLILDPYMGSGPVAQACYELGRRYIGIEIEERYCEIAIRRLGQGVLQFD